MSKNSEHHDTYIIPPNFIEGSTLFGGMFKIRNVIEAGVLAAAVGVPVFSLDLSLTVRIIILCLTALPLALFALMGIAGEPLSSYIIAFFKWLKNRRVVGKTEPKEERKKPKPKKEKQPAPENESMLSEIAGVIRKQSAKKKHTEEPRAAETPKQKKPHRRSKADSPFLNPVAEYLPIEKIANGIIYTKDHRYIKLIEVVPINFLLRSAREQRSIIYSFISYLKISPVKIQFIPVHVLGEELTACGVIPDLSRKISVIRSRNISMSCVFQNLAGLQNRYPLNQWQEILGNSDVQLFLGCVDELTAKYISDRSGEVSVHVQSKAKQLGTWRISNYTPEYRETSGVGKRKLLTMDEVLRLPISKALIIIRGRKLLQVDKCDYTEHPESKKMISCKASAHIPEWQKQQPKEVEEVSPAPIKKPGRKKKTPASNVVPTDKDSIMSKN